MELALGTGLTVGIILALTGAGGAIIAVPLLVFFLGLPLAEASPVALLAVALASALGASVGLKNKVLRYKAAIVMSGFGLVMTPLGLWAAKEIPNRPLSGIFAIVLLYVSVTIYLRAAAELQGVRLNDAKGPPCLIDETHGRLIWNLPCFKAMASVGALSGFLSGLLGVGGGFVIVPALNKVTDFSAHAILATSLGVITIVSLGAVLQAAMVGSVNWNIALPFSTGALFGMLGGGAIGQRIRGPRLQQAFALLAFCAAISMLFRIV